MRKVLVIVDAGPYGTASAAEGYRVLQGLGGMDIPTTCLLLGDGVFVALKNQKPENIDMQSLEKAYSSLKEFGVQIFVFEESLKERGIKEDDLIEIEGLITAESARKLIDEHHCVINFTSGS